MYVHIHLRNILAINLSKIADVHNTMYICLFLFELNLKFKEYLIKLFVSILKEINIFLQYSSVEMSSLDIIHIFLDT